MQFETFIEFNEQGFQLKIFNDKSYVYIQILCMSKPLIWTSVVELNNLVEKFDFLEGCFNTPDDLAEYLIYMVNNGELRLESADEESRVLNLIFWVQKEKEEEILQYEFYFSLIEEPVENERNDAEGFQSNNVHDHIELNNENDEELTRQILEMQRNAEIQNNLTNKENQNQSSEFKSNEINKVPHEIKNSSPNKKDINLHKNEEEDDLNILNEIEEISNSVRKNNNEDEVSNNYSKNLIFEADHAQEEFYKNNFADLNNENINTTKNKSEIGGFNEMKFNDHSRNKTEFSDRKENLFISNSNNNNTDQNNHHKEKAELEKQLEAELHKQQQKILEEVKKQRTSLFQELQEEIEQSRRQAEERIKEELNAFKDNGQKLIAEELETLRKEEENKQKAALEKQMLLEQQRIQEQIDLLFESEKEKIEADLHLKKRNEEELIEKEIDEKRVATAQQLRDYEIQREMLKHEIHNLNEAAQAAKAHKNNKNKENENIKIIEQSETEIEENLLQYQKQKQEELNMIFEQEELRIKQELKNKMLNEVAQLNEILKVKRDNELNQLEEEIEKTRKQEEEKLMIDLAKRKNNEENKINDDMKTFKLKEEKKISEELEKLRIKQEEALNKLLKEKEEKLIKEHQACLAKKLSEIEIENNKILKEFDSEKKEKNEELRKIKNMSLERLIDENDFNDNQQIHKIKCTEKSHLDLEDTIATQKNKITDLEKKIGDLIHNQNYFMEMMGKMNNLSFQILEEIKELKEKNFEKEDKKSKSYLAYDYSNHVPIRNNDINKTDNNNNNQNSYEPYFNENKNNKSILNSSSIERNRLNSIENKINKNSLYNYSRRINQETNSRDKYNGYDRKNKDINNKYGYYDSLQEKTKSILKFRNLAEQESNIPTRLNNNSPRKHSNSRLNTYSNNIINPNLNNVYNEKNNNSFYTNKISNINNNNNNNLLNNNDDCNIADETIQSISNDLKILQTNLNDSKSRIFLNNNNNNNIKNNFNNNLNNSNLNNHSNIINNSLTVQNNQSAISEIIPSFFKTSKNEKLFANFEIQEKTIKKLYSNNQYDYGFFGIRCRDPINSFSNGKFYFSVFLQQTQKSSIFLGMTSDARMGIPGGFHKTPNSFMFNLATFQPFVRGEGQVFDYGRKGRSGDIYTFFVDFEACFMKLFLNGNELSHVRISVGKHEGCFYPCVDVKDAEDTVAFVDRIILNFVN